MNTNKEKHKRREYFLLHFFIKKKVENIQNETNVLYILIII